LQKSVGDGWPRISSANALQKERSGSSERGPSSERGSAGETAGSHIERKCASRVGLTAKDGRGPAQDPGWREIVIQRFSDRQKRCGGRGTGAVKATGSYEGSLPMEGIPDHHEASAFTRRRQRWSWQFPHPPTRTKPSKKKDVRPGCSTGESTVRREGETEIATGVSEARSHQHRGKKTPTLVSPGREAVELESRVR